MKFRVNGEDLKVLRLGADKSTNQAAQVAGVSRQTYEGWEKGVGEPRLNQSLSLFRCFGFTPLVPFLEQIESVLDQLKHAGVKENGRCSRK